MVIVVVGLMGAGTAALGASLAERLGWAFADAENHTEQRCREAIVRALDRRESLVLARAALTADSRARLGGGLHQVRFVYLEVPEAVLRERLATRRAGTAPIKTLERQLATLGDMGDETLTVDGTADVDTIVGRIRLEFGL